MKVKMMKLEVLDQVTYLLRSERGCDLTKDLKIHIFIYLHFISFNLDFIHKNSK